MGFLTANLPGGSSGAASLSGTFSGFSPVWSPALILPTGRELLDGGHDVVPSEVRLFVGGKDGTRTVSIRIGAIDVPGAGSAPVSGSATGSWSVADTGEPSLSAWRGLATTRRDGGSSVVVEIHGNGSFRFKRNSAGTGVTRRVGAANAWASAIIGDLRCYQGPTAPATPNAVVSGTGATISWSAPSDDGGTAVTGYRLQVDDNPSFTSPDTYDQTELSKVLSGLAPGTYYARVASKNLVTTLAGTTSMWSTTKSFEVKAGVKVKSGGVYISAIAKPKVAGVRVVAVPKVKIGGVYVPTS